MKYIKLLRVKHYIKNFLIFLPLFFNGSIFNKEKLRNLFVAFIVFCLASSCIYIINDIKDKDIDKKNKYKKNRPVASGDISVEKAIIMLLILFVLSFLIVVYLNNIFVILCLLIYFFINIIYSFGAKNFPIVDIAILVSGFVIRVVYGSIVTDINISNWLFLTVFAFSFFFALCKRRNEMREVENLEKRKVLKYYNEAFLDKNMYMFLCIGIVFYSLWTIDIGISNLIWTVPLVSIITLKYSLNVEGNSSGDPIEVFFNDKILLTITLIYTIIVYILIYRL